MKFSYDWLKELVPTLPSPKETAEMLTMHALEVESVVEQDGDSVLDVDVLPNRMADASSHMGIARELAAILMMRGGLKKSPFEVSEPKLEESDKKAKDFVDVKITDRQGCTFYAVRVIGGVEVKDSPAWLKKRLRALGVEPINNIVDASNYVMLEMGQPLHAFDFAKIIPGRSGGKVSDGPKKIIVRKAKTGEKMKALDGETHTLNSSVTVISDAKRVLAIGGVKGGASSGISTKTKRLVLEAAVFDSARIYKTSRLTGIATDASKRFEAGRYAVGTVTALNRLAQLIVEISGGEVMGGVISAGSASVRGRAIPLSLEYTSSLLGVSVPAKDARRALEALGCVVRAKGKGFVVTPPKNRTDLIDEEDIIEEVGRLIGYTVVDDDLPGALLIPAKVPDRYKWADAARDALRRQGMREVMRYSFVSLDFIKSWGMGAYEMRAMANPQSSDLTHLRPSLLPGLLALAEAERKTRASVRVFEVGAIFIPKPKDKLVELTSLGFVLAHEKLEAPKEFLGEHSAFFEAKGVVEEILEALGLTDIDWHELSGHEAFWSQGRSAEVLVGGERVGVVGELAGDALKKHKDIGLVAMAEFNLDILADKALFEHQYQAPSKFPEVLRDISVLVPTNVTTGEVNQAIVTAGPVELRDVDLLDYYTGENVEDGMKSLAFRLAYQSREKTLTDRAVNKAQIAIEEALVKRNWEIR